MQSIVVIGAGQAGSSLVAKLRALGYAGRLVLIGEEHVPPYQRPPLSKKYLLGEMPVARLLLRPESFYAENGIELRLDETARTIDRADKLVITGGQALSYDRVVLTTGSVPRRLPAAVGGLLEGVHVVRGLSDVDAMAPEFAPGRHVLIVGGGYIGLEAAAVAAARGLKVTLIEMADRILQRVAAPQTSDYFRALHARHGVDIREGVGLERLLGGEAGRVCGAQLSDGSELAADFVIVGVGITPATALAEAAGLACDNGITVDAEGRTGDPDIWAAGDCACFPHDGGRLRLESVPNAIDMAECVAENLMGAGRAYVPKPWFWSDQYDVKLQIAGLGAGHDRVVTRQGEGGVSFWYYRGARLLAVDAANDARAYMVGKRLIDAGRSPDPAAVADPGRDLKTLLQA